VTEDHPLFGIGPGLFERGFLLHNFPVPEGSLPTRYGMRSAHAHSEFLQTAAETGWPGLALYLWALGFVLVRIWRRRELNWTQEAALSAFHAVLVQTFFDNILNLPALQWLYFSCLAVAWGEVATNPALRRSMVWPRIACAGGLAMAAAAWIPDRVVDRYRDFAYQSSGEESVHWMRRALAIAPGDPGLWEDLTRLYLRQSPPEVVPALEALSEASRRNPTSAIYPVMRGEILSSQGRWKEVQICSKQALALEPQFAEARLLRARALCHLGNRGGARRELEMVKSMRGLETDPNKSNGYTGMILYLDASAFSNTSHLVLHGCGPATK
jgi:tetratricopeptide (TPR) repeat protein